MSQLDMSSIARRSPNGPRRYVLTLLVPQVATFVIERPLLIGRSSDCDVVLIDDKAASRAHARLAPTPRGVEIADLHSRNGVYVDGRRIGAPEIVTGGVVRLGDSVGVVIPEPEDGQREHMEELPALFAHMLARASNTAVFTADAFEALALYAWPQNLRDLGHVIRDAATVANGLVDLQHLPDGIQAGFRPRPGRRPSIERLASSSDRLSEPELDRTRLDQTLRAHGGNLRQTSSALGIARSQLYRLLKRWAIDPADYRGARVEVEA